MLITVSGFLNSSWLGMVQVAMAGFRLTALGSIVGLWALGIAADCLTLLVASEHLLQETANAQCSAADLAA